MAVERREGELIRRERGPMGLLVEGLLSLRDSVLRWTDQSFVGASPLDPPDSVSPLLQSRNERRTTSRAPERRFNANADQNTANNPLRGDRLSLSRRCGQWLRYGGGLGAFPHMDSVWIG